jgi:hypothetical protein
LGDLKTAGTAGFLSGKAPSKPGRMPAVERRHERPSKILRRKCMSDKSKVESEGLPTGKEELISRINRDWSALLETVEKLSHDQMIKVGPGDWSTKDILAHISFWERYLLFHHLQGKPSYEVMRIDKGLIEQFDENRINALFFERSRHNSVSYTLEDLHQTHAELLVGLESVAFETLEKPGEYDDRTKLPLIQSVLANTCDHYREHLETIHSITESK